MADNISLAIDKLASAAFIEGGVSIERTEEARERTDQRKRELIEAIADSHRQAVAAQAAPAAVATPDQIAFLNSDRDGWIEAHAKIYRAYQDLRNAADDLLTCVMHDGVLVDPEHPKRIAVEAVKAALCATPALPATEDSSAGDTGDWSIDVSAGREILVYKNCSVIEAEQAHLVLSLIRQAELQAEPVAWLICRSAFRVSPDGQDAEGHEWLEEADEPGMEGSFPVYTAPQAQPADALDARRGGKWLTVVYRDVQPGDEAREIGSHQKVAALSWSHALDDRDAAMAAAQEGGKAAKEA